MGLAEVIIGVSIGIIGSIGLGLLTGSEFSGSTITVLGAIMVVISLISLIVFSFIKK